MNMYFRSRLWFFVQLTLIYSLVPMAAFSPTSSWALPTSGCVESSLPNILNDCTLVEAPQSGPEGGDQLVTVALINLQAVDGFVPIFESASGVPNSGFPLDTNPDGVVGTVSDYLIILGNNSASLASDSLPSGVLQALLNGLTKLQPLAATVPHPILWTLRNARIELCRGSTVIATPLVKIDPRAPTALVPHGRVARAAHAALRRASARA